MIASATPNHPGYIEEDLDALRLSRNFVSRLSGRRHITSMQVDRADDGVVDDRSCYRLALAGSTSRPLPQKSVVFRRVSSHLIATSNDDDNVLC